MRTVLTLLGPTLLAIGASPLSLSAADGTYTFNLLPDPGNMTACIGLEPSFERPYSLMMSGDSGTLTSDGGISIQMSPKAPSSSGTQRYHGVFEIAFQRFDYTADLSTKTLSVVGNNLGCKFTGKAS